MFEYQQTYAIINYPKYVIEMKFCSAACRGTKYEFQLNS